MRGILGCELAPFGADGLFLHQRLQVHAAVKLVGFSTWVADEALGVKLFCDLVRRVSMGRSLNGRKLTSITTLDVKPRNLLPNFCSSTVVNGSGFLLGYQYSYFEGERAAYNFLVGLVFTAVTLAVLAWRHLSNRMTVIMRSNSLFRSQLKVTLTSSFL